jgi:CDP-glycerol glycerophosphotransferase
VGDAVIGEKDGARPDVTVVVIVYNDADHLADAVRSVLNQSLHNVEVIIVDDCSTDGSATVAAALVEADPRVRYARLPENSGGCGAPRNLGVDLARGRYVTFLDSDDVLTRHACLAMVDAADRAGADVTCGRIVRVDVATGRRSGWYDYLFAVERVVDSIDEYPELTRDTAATAKVYRRDFLLANGINFEPRVHYEELPYSALVYTAAKRIVVLPFEVYEWRVYDAETRKSISNQRDELSNLHQRLAALRSVETIVRRHGSATLELEVERKALNHHLKLYLIDTYEGSDEFARSIVAELTPIVAAMRPAAFDAIDQYDRFAYSRLLVGDLRGMREALAHATRLGLVTGRSVDVAGVRRWLPSSPDVAVPDGLAGELARLDHCAVGRLPFPRLRLCHEVRAVERTPDGLRLHGRTHDPFLRLSALGVRTGHVVLESRESASTVAAGEAVIDFSNPSLPTWSFDLPIRGLDIRAARERWGVYMTLRGEFGQSNRSALRITSRRARSAGVVGASSALPRTLGLRFRLYSTRFGNLAVRPFDMRAAGPIRAVWGRALHVSSVLRRTLGRAIPEPTSRLGLGVVYRAMRWVPLDRRRALFEANMGRTNGESPGAVLDALRAREPGVRVFHVVEAGVEPAAGAAPVTRGSYGYLWQLSRARLLVDNQSFPRYFVKRRGQRYLQTWHGVPLKKMGLDEPRTRMSSPAEKASLVAQAAKWDGLISPSDFFTRVFVPAFGYEGTVLPFGSPRLDRLVSGAIDADAVKRALDIDADSRVVLYAPTFRERQTSRKRATPIPFSLDDWTEQLGPDLTLVVRSHYLNRFAIADRFAGRVVDASSWPDVAELYAIADVLVTDYSSTMFDFAHLRRPIVLFCFDYDDYAHRSRGMYFDLRTEAPGPFVTDPEDLVPAVRRALDGVPGAAHERFLAQYCGPEDGRASERAVAWLTERGK